MFTPEFQTKKQDLNLVCKKRPHSWRDTHCGVYVRMGVSCDGVMLSTYVETVLLRLWHSHALFYATLLTLRLPPIIHCTTSKQLWVVVMQILHSSPAVSRRCANENQFCFKKKELTFLGTLCSMRAKNHNTSLQGFSYGIDERWDSDGEREGFRGEEQRTRGEWKVRKNGCAKYRELSKNKKKGHGNKKRGWGLGGFYSQVFLPFEEGIPPFKEENN